MCVRTHNHAHIYAGTVHVTNSCGHPSPRGFLDDCPANFPCHAAIGPECSEYHLKSVSDSKSTPPFPHSLPFPLLSSKRSTANSAQRSAWLERSWSAKTGIKTPVLSAAGFTLAPVSRVPSRSQDAARVLKVGKLRNCPLNYWGSTI